MSVLQEARGVARDHEPRRPELGQRFLDATREVYESGHSPRVKQLKKSTELTSYIRLLPNTLIYPEGTLLRERLELCLELLEFCVQRPILEEVGLTLLKLDFTHHWTQAQPSILTAILDLDTRQSRHRTIPILALCMHHSADFAQEFASRIAQSTIIERKTRIGELIETLHIMPRDEPIETFVNLAYGAIFKKTTPEEKANLLRRVIRECVQKRMFEHDDRWIMLIDPIISQNLHNDTSIFILEDLMENLPESYATRYMINYTMVLAQNRHILPDSLLNLLDNHAPPKLIPYLYPSTLLTERSLLGSEKKTPYAERVQSIIDAIVEREQLDRNSGGLSLAEHGSTGGLTVLDASQGTLSVEASSEGTPHDPTALLPPVHETVLPPLPNMYTHSTTLKKVLLILVVGAMVTSLLYVIMI